MSYFRWSHPQFIEFRANPEHVEGRGNPPLPHSNIPLIFPLGKGEEGDLRLLLPHLFLTVYMQLVFLQPSTENGICNLDGLSVK